MCGIIGCSSLRRAGIGRDLHAELEKLSRQRPDDSGYIEISADTKVLLLGHTRLSIIDLSVAGHQPMTTTDGRWTIVFNGEIYNYRE